MKFQNLFVPSVYVRGAFALFEYYVITRVVCPKYAKPTTDWAIAFEDLWRLLRKQHNDSTAMARGCV